MGFLNFFKKENSLQSKKFILTEHFKGFKAFPFVVHGNEESEKNNELLKDVKLPGHSITFSYEKNYVLIFIDTLKIGAIFDVEQIKQLECISAVYAKMDTENIIEKNKAKQRHRIHLFVKYEV